MAIKTMAEFEAALMGIGATCALAITHPDLEAPFIVRGFNGVSDLQFDRALDDLNKRIGKSYWVSVDSSNIKAVRYLAGKQELHVRFHSGGEFAYSGVQQVEFTSMMSAESKGRFFAKEIQSKHQARPL